MTTSTDGWLEALAAAASAASAAETEHQREAARRTAEHKSEREFAWRRLNLMRAVAAAARGAEEAPAAAAAATAAMLGEAGLTGTGEAQQALAARFQPVALAVWTAGRGEPGEEPAAALAAFETWYAEDRGRPFLALMEREVVELPLVEI
jgi:hypothetical protein